MLPVASTLAYSTTNKLDKKKLRDFMSKDINNNFSAEAPPDYKYYSDLDLYLKFLPNANGLDENSKIDNTKDDCDFDFDDI